MNILPKKRWHVRTKDNIARVRRDEAAAQEEERKREEKLKIAESEARINFLRRKSGLPEKVKAAEQPEPEQAIAGDSGGHFDLFADYKSHIKATNKDLEREKKEEQEKYEKQIGYLTYLGQDTNESLKVRSWYEQPTRIIGNTNDDSTAEKDQKKKQALDPLTLINALLPQNAAIARTSTMISKQAQPTSTLSSTFMPRWMAAEQSSKKERKLKKEHKKHKQKKHKRHKERERERAQDLAAAELKRLKLQKLREERLQREAKERSRQEALLAPTFAATSTITKEVAASLPPPRVLQKYSSQFNPDLARQNFG